MASITCGTCRKTHGSASEVRACGLQAGDFAEEDGYARRERYGFGGDNVRPLRSNGRDAVKALRPHVLVALGKAFPGQRKLRFAITMDDSLHFFEASLPQKGKWAGSLFLHEQAGDMFYRVRGWDRELAILTALGADVVAAVATYGQEIGDCGICGRTLTDEESRDRGIGPVCLRKMGVA